MFSDLPPLPEWAPMFGLGILGIAVLLTVLTGFEASLTGQRGQVTGFKIEFKGFRQARKDLPPLDWKRTEPPLLAPPKTVSSLGVHLGTKAPAPAGKGAIVVDIKSKKKAAKSDRSEGKRAKRSA